MYLGGAIYRTKRCYQYFDKPIISTICKIGYADDVIDRVATLNRNPCLLYSFRIFVTYEVDEGLEYLKIHKIIDMLNPTLRYKEEVNGKTRVHEFFAMTANVVYTIFEAVAGISGTKDKLHK